MLTAFFSKFIAQKRRLLTGPAYFPFASKMPKPYNEFSEQPITFSSS